MTEQGHDHDHDLTTLLDWRGRAVLDRKGETIGKLGDLYLDEATDRAAYAGVRTGLFGRHESIVPLARMTERDDGDLVVPYDSELVRDAPKSTPTPAWTTPSRRASPATTGRRGAAPVNPEDGAEMIRSEEEVVTGTTEMRPAERVRIRKVLVTDHVKREVPVRREEIRLETDPPPDGHVERVEDAGPAADAP